MICFGKHLSFLELNAVYFSYLNYKKKKKKEEKERKRKEKEKKKERKQKKKEKSIILMYTLFLQKSRGCNLEALHIHKTDMNST